MRYRTAGRYTVVVRYTRSLPGDNAPVRSAKRAATTNAQKYINVKNATERLQLLLCANFDNKAACFCTFTFADEALPANRKHTKAIFAGYIRRLKKALNREGRPFKYIYTIEGEPLTNYPAAAPVVGNRWEIKPWKEKKRWEQLDTPARDGTETPKRFHAHGFLYLRKEDYETVRSLWPYGQVYISPMKVNELTTFKRLANYVTKESRIGVKGNGDRSYVPSTNLAQPVENGHWCSEFEGIVLPMGAERIDSNDYKDDIYGSSWEYLSYRMPRDTHQPQPYKSKGKVYSKKSRLQSK